MADRKTQSEYRVDGRIFIIKRMTPVKGISILKELLTRSLPIDFASMLGSQGNSMNKFKGLLGGTSSAISPMGIDEFEEFQLRILDNVKEVLASGEVPITDGRGNFTVEGLETDIGLVMKLEIEVLKENYQDFFIELLQNFKIITEDKAEQASS